jgi:hypothetical protein
MTIWNSNYMSFNRSVFNFCLKMYNDMDLVTEYHGVIRTLIRLLCT